MGLEAYAGRWVALLGEQVIGVGYTADQAEHLARRNRPRERFTLRFVERPSPNPLPLSPLLDDLRPLLQQQEIPTYLVGGAVRDAVLGRMSHDLDFVVPRGGIQLAFAIANKLGAAAYVLDRERDTGRVVLPEHDTVLDFACFRGPTLEDDLRDRDFTINALALPATAQRRDSIIDPCGGLTDLAARLIRPTHADAVQSDPVRALRAVRLAHGLDFTLPPEARTAVARAVPLLQNVSAERVRDEITRILKVARPAAALRDMHALGLLAATLPEVDGLEGLAQSPPHHEDALSHTFSVVAWLATLEHSLFEDPTAPDAALALAVAALQPFRTALQVHAERTVDGGVNGCLLLRLGAVFHDVGKPDTAETDDKGRVRFFGHDQTGADLAAARLRQLAFSREAVGHVQAIVAGHMRPLLLLDAQGAATSRRAAYRFFRDSGSAGLDIMLLALADVRATHAGGGLPPDWEDLVNLVTGLLQFYFEQHLETIAPPPLVNGRDIMDLLDIPPGPEIGRLLRLIEEAQAAGEVTTRAEALQMARNSYR